ncbi:MAG: LacI family DNA-binding transcriptional regulator [Spirochaetales bacterium]|nr:LacI family DNA-binding transcriptional regulator [Spirochaetales bacterium]
MTIKELAKLAGVSHSTVSRSLNDNPSISSETKERIRDLADKHNFAFNASARSLSTRKTGTIGIIFPELYDHYRNLQYLGLLLNSLRFTLEKEDYDSIVTFPVNSHSGQSNIRKLIRQKKVDGLILVITDIGEEDWDILRLSTIPTISLHFKWKNHHYQEIDYIYTDHCRGGYLATEHLIKHGRKNLITLSEVGDFIEYKERTKGFLQALETAALPVGDKAVFAGTCSFEYGYYFVKENRSLLSRVDGIFAQADFTALGCIEALKELGIRVPEDLAVVGYDDIEIGKFFRPHLTTIHQPRERHTKLACQRLIALIKGEEATEDRLQQVIEPSLVVRESCGALK